MDLDSEQLDDRGIEPHEKFGGCLLVLVLLGLAGVVVYHHDVPYVDDAIAELQEIDVNALAADLHGLFPDGDSGEELDLEEPKDDEEEVETAPAERATGTPSAAVEERPEPRPYDAPAAGYREAGFNPDEVELDLSAGGPAGQTGQVRRLTDRQIQNVVDANRHQLVDCYADTLDTYGEMSGAVEFDFAVGNDGEVRMVEIVDSTLRSHEAEECFVERAQNWSFPETGAGQPTRFQNEMQFQY